MTLRKLRRRLIPKNRGEAKLAVQSAVGKIGVAPKEVSDKIEEFLGVIGPEYLSDVDAHLVTRANVNNARDDQHQKNDAADEAVTDFLTSAKLNGGDSLLDELLRELGTSGVSRLLSRPDREQVVSIGAFITRVEARGLKVPAERFELVKSTQSALQASIFVTDAAVEAQAAASAKVDASEAKVLAAYRAMVTVLKLVVGEDAVYEHLLTFDTNPRKTTDAESTDDTETP